MNLITPPAIENGITLQQAVQRAVSVRRLSFFEQGDLRPLNPHHKNLYDPPLQVLEFRNCLVNRHGFVKLSSGEVITDIGYQHLIDASVAELNDAAPRTYEPETASEPLILVGGHQNYYHWHFNWLPRLALADRFADLRSVRALVKGPMAPYMADSLEMVTRRKARDCVALGWKLMRVPQLYVPAMFINPLHAPFALRSYEALREMSGPNPPTKRLYISRSEARLRRVLNEAEVVSLLNEYGFETVVAENLTYIQQVQLFSQASHIVGAHGAGLTNILFCRPGVSVVELCNQYYTTVYWSLQYAMGGAHYRSVPSDRIAAPVGEEDPVQRIKNSDFYVDLAKLRAEVEITLGKR